MKIKSDSLNIKMIIYLLPFFSCIDKDIANCMDVEKARAVLCPEIYDPVCGCNDKTYPNSCYAEREGITDWSRGSCD